MGEGEQFKLAAANGTPIPFKGWAELKFCLTGETALSQGMTVPVLVSTNEIERPIIGYNVIEMLVKTEDFYPSINSAFPGLQPAQVAALVGFINTNDPDNFCEVKLGKEDVVIPAGENRVVTGRAHPGPVTEDMTVLFEPDVQRCWPEGLQIDE